MLARTNERRKYKRYPLSDGLLFSDDDCLVGFAKVLDISRSGVRCCTLSQITCSICTLDNIELFGAGENMILSGLSGRMTRCTSDLSKRKNDLNICLYEFGFEFYPYHYSQIEKLQKRLLSYKKKITDGSDVAT